MQNRITKSCQNRRSCRADRLRELLQLTPGDSVLLDACKRKKAKDGSYTFFFNFNRKFNDSTTSGCYIIELRLNYQKKTFRMRNI